MQLKTPLRVNDVATDLKVIAMYIKLNFVLLLSVLLASSSFGQAPHGTSIPFEHFSKEGECPSINDLNRTTQHWHEDLIENMAQHSDIPELLSLISPDINLHRLRPLSNIADRETCAQLNTNYWDLHTDVMHDREKSRMVPAHYYLYYQSGGYFIVVAATYSGGVEDSLDIGPPSLGNSVLSVYDSNMELMARLPW